MFWRRDPFSEPNTIEDPMASHADRPIHAAASPQRVATEASAVHDVFISYSRKDLPFARLVKQALERYLQPRDPATSRRHLNVFLDEDDFTGVEYHASLTKHLSRSARLLVICSPDARASIYVNDEIKVFAATKGANNIIAVLFRGIPNNEATPEQQNQRAFPDSLCDALPMPEETM
jgi:hypothetical protein